MTRPDGRAVDELRPVTFELGFQEWAAGSVLFSDGSSISMKLLDANATDGGAVLLRYEPR